MNEPMIPVSELKALAEKLDVSSEARLDTASWFAVGEAAQAVRDLVAKYERGTSLLGEVGVIVSRLVGPWHGGLEHGEVRPTAQAQRTGIKVAFALADAELLALPEWEQEYVRVSKEQSGDRS